MSFFKRLSRSRTNSQSYVDEDFEREPQQQQQQHQQPQPQHHQALQAHDPASVAARPPSSYRSPDHFAGPATAATAQDPTGAPQGTRMYGSARNSADISSWPASRQQNPAMSRGGSGMTRDSGYADESPGMPPKQPDMFQQQQPPSSSHHPAPDPLTRAFNEAIRPYKEKIDALEAQMGDMQAFVDQMEQQRMEIFAWIDKRGLRPDVPDTMWKAMDETPEAANALNAQLDRKITIVNFDLHRLQDDLNDSISSAHFASAMAKFLPDVERLSNIRGGPRYAYELVIKLVGNLNSHGGLEAGAGGSDAELEEDRRAREAFYARMDDELLKTIQKRFSEGEDWAVGREVKRLEKNGAYLRNLGIDSYFPRSLDRMRGEAQYVGGTATPPRYQ